MTCQSVMQPSTAEYWHIGAMTIRLANSRVPTRNGVNSALMPTSPDSSFNRQVGVSLSTYFRKTRSTVVFPQPAGRVRAARPHAGHPGGERLAEVVGRRIGERARITGVTQTMPGHGIEHLAGLRNGYRRRL